MVFNGLYFVIVVLAALSKATGSEEVILPYDCCDPNIRINSACENILSHNGVTFAVFSGTRKDCSTPCEGRNGDMVTLSKCVDVTVSPTCTNGNGQIKGVNRTKYVGQLCPDSQRGNSSPGCQASITVLLMLLMAGRFLLQGIC
ncbi:uncharacterized protein LOC144984488 [Oryzias latipes]